MSSESPQTTSAPPVILYAEDNNMLSVMVKDLLELAGWRVERVSDGVYALAHLRLRDHYDIVILDKELPNLDGLDIIRDARLHEHRKHTPIILLSLEDCAKRAHEAGADAFLQKPNNLFSLVDTVRRLLAQGER